MDAAYPRIAERLFGHPHAIEPGSLRSILDGPVARRILSGEKARAGKKRDQARMRRLSALVDAEWVSVGKGIGEYALTSDGVAIVPVCGVLSRRFDWLTAMCGWTTYDGLAATFEAMQADSRVRAILMDVESPGGEAAGMLDIADRILAARGDKPIWAVANAYAASAAYAIAGCAERLVLPRLAEVGSIGAVIVHVDQSKWDQEIGLAYTAIYSGDRKIDGWGHAPISEEARAALQAGVDHCRAEFAGLVGRQGRIDAKAALSTEAALYADAAAVEAGLADAAMTFEAALAELTDIAAGRPRTSGAAAATAVTQRGDDPMTKTTGAGQKPAKSETEKPEAAAAAPEAEAEAPKTPAAAAESDEDKKPEETRKKAKKKAEEPDDDEGDDEDYSAEAAAETLELCTLAGASLADARAFVTAKTPVAKVRATLAARKAQASDAVEIDPTRPAAAAPGSWDSVIAKKFKGTGSARR